MDSMKTALRNVKKGYSKSSDKLPDGQPKDLAPTVKDGGGKSDDGDGDNDEMEMLKSVTSGGAPGSAGGLEARAHGKMKERMASIQKEKSGKNC